MAMSVLGAGLSAVGNHEESLSVKEAELSRMRRLGASQHNILAAQSNLAITYDKLGRCEEALHMREDVYSVALRLFGGEHRSSLVAAKNYAMLLRKVSRFEEAKSLMRKAVPVARRVLGDSHDLTLSMRSVYADALWLDPAATLDDLREAVTALEDVERIARRVLGGAHPNVAAFEKSLRDARATLRARETPNA
jgi:hypothetical protein